MESVSQSDIKIKGSVSKREKVSEVSKPEDQ